MLTACRTRGQVTTARDMAKLGIALREHYPRQYKYFSARSFKFGGTTMGNHNRLLGTVRGVDGIKTGYTRASGFNLVSSVVDSRPRPSSPSSWVAAPAQAAMRR